MNLDLEQIHFHDSRILRVIEDPDTNELVFEVTYPVDWEKNEFAPRRIVFTGALEYTVREGPFAGRPAILDVSQVGVAGKRAILRIDTNAGYRTLQCTGVELRL